MFRYLHMTLLPAALLSGCYASIGPTIGYRTGDGFTYGAEVDGAAFVFAHGNTGFFMREAREKEKDRSSVTTWYGTIGPGVIAPTFEGQTLWIGNVGVGMTYDRETAISFLGSLHGGLSVMTTRLGGYGKEMGSVWDPGVHTKGVVFNVLLGMSFSSEGVWFNFSPQAGVLLMPNLFHDD
ncbi:MAG: hypothetical protein HY897_24905 [Deltaproteobacteria bacterium]|nr:hypothetical protein [Deltaproteobacteria bacterium]